MSNIVGNRLKLKQNCRKLSASVASPALATTCDTVISVENSTAQREPFGALLLRKLEEMGSISRTASVRAIERVTGIPKDTIDSLLGAEDLAGRQDKTILRIAMLIGVEPIEPYLPSDVNATWLKAQLSELRGRDDPDDQRDEGDDMHGVPDAVRQELIELREAVADLVLRLKRVTSERDEAMEALERHQRESGRPPNPLRFTS